MMSLSGKVALVTGGSVGKELARAFLEAGSKVAFIYRNAGREAGLRDSFGKYAESADLIRADLSNFDEAKDAVRSAASRFGGIDFLLNSLGGWIGGKKLHEHTPSELSQMLSIDVLPTFNIMSAVMPVMIKRRFGRIVNFVSMQVYGTGAGSSVYSASKSAILALTRAAAEEYKDYGVSVYGIAPSVIDTPGNRKSMPNADTGKWVKIQEIVDSILFLCGTGESLNGTILKFPGKLQ